MLFWIDPPVLRSITADGGCNPWLNKIPVPVPRPSLCSLRSLWLNSIPCFSPFRVFRIFRGLSSGSVPLRFLCALSPVLRSEIATEGGCPFVAVPFLSAAPAFPFLSPVSQGLRRGDAPSVTILF